MRLVYVSHSFPPPGRPLANVGGMQRVATGLYDALAARDDLDLTPLLLRTTWAATHPRMAYFLPYVALRLRALVRSGPPGVVLYSSMVTAWTAPFVAPALRRRGWRLAAIAHGLDVTTPVAAYQRLVVPRVFGALDRILPISRATAAACLARGAREDQIAIVPNGIDPTRLAPATTAEHDALKQGLAGPTDTPQGHNLVLLSVGRHVRRKGFAWFASEVMPRLPQNVVWWLVGEGPETDAVRAAAEAHGLGERIRLLGRVDDATMDALYRAADLFVMPNRPVDGDMEGFGVVMLEAGLAGTPTVGADLEGIPDVVTPGANGLLVPSGDADAFVRVLTEVEADRAALASLRDRTAAHVRQHFAWPSVADRYVEVLAALQRAESDAATLRGRS